jgi:putative endopeptidase
MFKKRSFLHRFYLLPLTLLLATANTVAIAQSTEDLSFSRNNLDISCLACRDFYQFATNRWREQHPLPPDTFAWNNFSALQANINQTLRNLVEAAAKETRVAPGSNLEKIGDFYASCLDMKTIERLGAKPLLSDLAMIDRVQNLRDLQAILAHLQRRNVSSILFESEIQTHPTRFGKTLVISPGGLTLPTMDYLDKEQSSKNTRQIYLKYVAQLFTLVGDRADQALANAKTVMKVESQLAKLSLDSQQPTEVNQEVPQSSLVQLQQLTEHFSWQQYVSDLGRADLQEINLSHPGYFKALDRLLVKIPIQNWKTYLRWHLVFARAPMLSSSFTQANEQFKTQYLQQKQIMTDVSVTDPQKSPKNSAVNASRSELCMSLLQENLSEPLNEAYVRQYSSPEVLIRVTAITNRVRTILREKLTTLDWMSAATRAKAIAKLDAVRYKIGYPDHWTAFSRLKIERGQFANNLVNSKEFLFQHHLNKVNKPLADDEWIILPQSVTVLYVPTRNEIIIPAAVLQPPFFSLNADDALNYGAIGMGIGHELVHSILASGNLYDANGNADDWWTAEDKQRYQERLKCITGQAASFNLSGVSVVNSKRTMDENAADLAGVSLAYAAFQKTMGESGKSKIIEGFTPAQRFFLSYAHVWAANYNLSYLTLASIMETHALAPFRVNGPLANLSAFATAFGCRQTDAMTRPPHKQCKIF